MKDKHGHVVISAVALNVLHKSGFFVCLFVCFLENRRLVNSISSKILPNLI